MVKQYKVSGLMLVCWRQSTICFKSVDQLRTLTCVGHSFSFRWLWNKLNRFTFHKTNVKLQSAIYSHYNQISEDHLLTPQIVLQVVNNLKLKTLKSSIQIKLKTVNYFDLQRPNLSKKIHYNSDKTIALKQLFLR